jgi:hypothetical protein
MIKRLVHVHYGLTWFYGITDCTLVIIRLQLGPPPVLGPELIRCFVTILN